MIFEDAFGTPDLYQVKNISEILRLQAEKRGDSPAILCENRILNYFTLKAHSEALATYFVSRSSDSQNKRIAFIGKECEAYYEVLFGCAQAGIIFVPINWRLTPPELAHILTDAGIFMVFCDAGTLPIVEEGLRACNHPANVICLDKGLTLVDYDSVLKTVPLRQIFPSPNPERIFCIIYTSGTTGLPKGVCLSHKAFFQIRESMIIHGLKWLDWYPSDYSLVGIPGFHIGGLWWALQSLSSGSAIVILPQFEPRLCADTMSKLGVSIACMVPAMINLLLDVIEEDNICLPKLRKIVYGGAPISTTLLQRGINRFDCEFAQIYGLSETGNTAICLDPESHFSDPRLLQAAGRPYPGVSIKIVDANGQTLSLGEIGEICINTPAKMAGYWGLPGATASVIQNGWIHTGDAGYLNENGYLFICDRLKDVIITGGEKIFPAEVENIISAFPSVHECAVIGIPDENWGELAICFLVPRSGVTVNILELYSYLDVHLAPYKRPTKIYCINNLPRNPSGKILRRALRDAFWTNRTRRV